jgi:hypothetical protein
VTHGQVVSKDPIKWVMFLDDVKLLTRSIGRNYCIKEKLDLDAKKRFLLAKQSLYNLSVCQIGFERLTLLNKGMTRLSSNRKKVFQDSGKLLK